MAYRLIIHKDNEYREVIKKAFSDGDWNEIQNVETANKLFHDAVLGLWIANKAMKQHEHVYLSSMLFKIYTDIKSSCNIDV